MEGYSQHMRYNSLSEVFQAPFSKKTNRSSTGDINKDIFNYQTNPHAKYEGQLGNNNAMFFDGQQCNTSGSIPICYNSTTNWLGGRTESIGQAEQSRLFSRP